LRQRHYASNGVLRSLWLGPQLQLVRNEKSALVSLLWTMCTQSLLSGATQRKEEN
jgi:hypothetical protein